MFKSLFEKEEKINRREGEGIGIFRSVRDGPKDAEGDYSESQRGLTLKNEGDETDVKNIVKMRSKNAEIHIGTSKGKRRRYLLSARKDDDEGRKNSRKSKSVDLNRTKTLHKRRYNTYSEDMDEAFLHRKGEEESEVHFYRYLESAAKERDTAPIKTIFPFLDLENMRREKSKLLDMKRDAKPDELPLLEAKITDMTRQINDVLFQRAVFKKRIVKLMTVHETDGHEATDEQSWFWMWLKRVKDWLVDDESEDD